MSQTDKLMRTLKRMLKARGQTYRQVAQALDLSEATVKRMFATANMSLERLDQICQMMSIDLVDLAREMAAEQERIVNLTEAQEMELISDKTLLLVAFLVVSGWRFEDIVDHIELNQAEVVRCLLRLDKLRMIDLLPDNRIKLLVSPNFSWLRNGPIQRHFTANFLEDFLHSGFARRNESFHFLSGMLTNKSIATLQVKLDKLLADFNDLKMEDQAKPLAQKRGYSTIVAMRPWRPSAMAALLCDNSGHRDA